MASFLHAAFTLLAFAAADAKPSPVPVPAIKFPDVAPAPGPKPSPAPVVDPTAAVKLTAESVYVIQSDSAFLLFASPENLVTITKETGPLKYRGKFIDGSGKVETRTLTGKFIAIVEAAGTGKVELIAVPVGADAESIATRRIIEANNGAQPPPDDKDKKDIAPAPKPKPPIVDDDEKEPTPKFDGPFFLMTVAESSARTADEAKVLNDVAYWKSLESLGHVFRHYDVTELQKIAAKYKDAGRKPNGEPAGNPKDAYAQGYINAYEALGTCLVIVTKDGTLVRKIKLPKSTAAVDEILKEVTR